jgi:ribokinase
VFFLYNIDGIFLNKTLLNMTSRNTICVIGSSNTDMVVKTSKLPSPGETVIGGSFLMNPGGKGANQAVSAARLGGRVMFVAKVGNDMFGKQAIRQFQHEKIDSRFVIIDPDQPSGVALINVDSDGENSIAVAPGSNASLRHSDVQPALDQLGEKDILLLQLEIPLDTVDYAIKQAFEKGCRIILNPAPAQFLTTDILSCLHIITPNETEAELLTDVKVSNEETARLAAEKLFSKGVKNVIITLGSKGAYLHNESTSKLISAPPVTALDTTAAGDCFNGALAVALSEDVSLAEAVIFACKAASVSVTRMGAQSSIPNRKEIESLPLVHKLNS